jgi:hypothetical protein
MGRISVVEIKLHVFDRFSCLSALLAENKITVYFQMNFCTASILREFFSEKILSEQLFFSSEVLWKKVFQSYDLRVFVMSFR